MVAVTVSLAATVSHTTDLADEGYGEVFRDICLWAPFSFASKRRKMGRARFCDANAQLPPRPERPRPTSLLLQLLLKAFLTDTFRGFSENPRHRGK